MRNHSPSDWPFRAVVFDLDGVVTQTARVHAAAWKAMFDAFLKSWSERHNIPFQEFTIDQDYRTYVDGKPRYKGVESFLKSRGIDLPWGSPEDDPSQETVCGLGNRKNAEFLKVLESDGVDVYSSTVRFIKELKDRGIRVGVASSSKNCRLILERAGLTDLFETRVDGEVSAKLGLKGKPEPDIFIRAAEDLGATPPQSVVVEDAVSGVQAGRAGQFGLVIGLAREDNAEALKAQGADVVIPDFEGVSVEQVREWFLAKQNERRENNKNENENK